MSLSLSSIYECRDSYISDLSYRGSRVRRVIGSPTFRRTSVRIPAVHQKIFLCLKFLCALTQSYNLILLVIVASSTSVFFYLVCDKKQIVTIASHCLKNQCKSYVA